MVLGSSTYVVLLAGGEGTRFAPLSTPECPKQFLRLFGDESLMQTTVNRFASLTKPERIFVTTNDRYRDLTRAHLPQIPEANILGEPLKKNTAPPLARAAQHLVDLHPEAVMVVLPADHIILDPPTFLEAIRYAEELAMAQDLLITLGIKPDRPAEEYGYIERGDPISSRAFHLRRFVEKPDHEHATAYLASGHFYWNSGMFVWRAARLLDELQQHAPVLHAALAQSTDSSQFFAAAPSISIDYAVMEHTQRAATIPVDCGWNDVGGWPSLRLLVERSDLALNPDVHALLDVHA
jgi:mannose-1-phosphate guanylyltransferase/mannose-6-phosphate isomerase